MTSWSSYNSVISHCGVPGCTALVVCVDDACTGDPKPRCGLHHGGRNQMDADWIETLYEELYYGCAWLW